MSEGQEGTLGTSDDDLYLIKFLLTTDLKFQRRFKHFKVTLYKLGGPTGVSAGHGFISTVRQFICLSVRPPFQAHLLNDFPEI